MKTLKKIYNHLKQKADMVVFYICSILLLLYGIVAISMFLDIIKFIW